MTWQRLRTVFLIDAIYSAATGVVFLAGTWDGLYEALDLAQSKPAIWTQIAGALLLGIAYLLWEASRAAAPNLPLARASAVMNALSVTVVVAWLIHGGLGIETRGEIALGAFAGLMAFFTLAYTAAAVRLGDQALRSGA